VACVGKNTNACSALKVNLRITWKTQTGRRENIKLDLKQNLGMFTVFTCLTVRPIGGL